MAGKSNFPIDKILLEDGEQVVDQPVYDQTGRKI
jgi:hypothetical protein